MRRWPTIAATLAAAAHCAAADPGYYVVTPYDNEGVRIVDLRYWSTHPQRGRSWIWPEIGFGYGVTSRWTTEVFFSFIGDSLGRQRLATVNWQNQVLLTQGELPVDVAVHLQYVRDRSGEREHAFEFGPLLQTDIGRTQLNLNFIFDKPLGAARGEPTQLKYQWQVRHRFVPPLHFGAQGFGELGPWHEWAPAAKQSHRAGPALFVTHRSGEHVYKLQAGYLFGRTYRKAGQMFTLRAHVEF